MVLALARRAGDGPGRRLRLAAGLSLAEMGALVGVDASTVARWEKGLTYPRLAHALAYGSVLEQLSEVLGGA